jgi:hypothetical protein
VDSNKTSIDPFTGDFRDAAFASADLAHIEVCRVDLIRCGKSIQKTDWQITSGSTELRPVRSIPGDNLVERLKRIQMGRVSIDPGRENRPHSIRETNQRNIVSRGPHFCVIGFQVLEGGQRNDQVTDRSWSDQQSFQLRISSGNFSSIVSGRRQTRSSQAW